MGRRRHTLGCLLGLSFAVAACRPTTGFSEGQLLKVLYSAGQCGTQREGFSASWLEGPDAVRAVVGRIRRGKLHPAAAGTRAGDVPASQALLIEMGRRSSAGYGLALDSNVLAVSQGTARVRVKTRYPRRGSSTAAVVTSPCLLLELPEGEYSRIEVLDASGNELTRVSLGH